MYTESNIIELTNNKLLIGGENYLYHINLFSYKIEIITKVDSFIYSMIHLDKNNFILGSHIIYSYNLNSIKVISIAHDSIEEELKIISLLYDAHTIIFSITNQLLIYTY